MATVAAAARRWPAGCAMPSSLLAHSALRDDWPPFFTEMGTVVYFLMF